MPAASTTMRWGAEDIWQSVVLQLPGFTVEVLPEVDSSNSELMRRAHAGLAEPVLLVAEQQSAGRGRLGRRWHGVRFDTLTFSLGLPLAPQDWSGLSLAVGLSLAQSLHPEISLKWPNDLWWNSSKLAGILIETANLTGPESREATTRYVVIGVGINLRTPPSTAFFTKAVGLEVLQPGREASQVLLSVMAPLVSAVLAFEQEGFAPLQAAFNARDALSEQVVTLSDGSHGLAQGVDQRGALRVHTAQGLRVIDSAEVSVRPREPLAAALS
jgi:BirA family biotin operon repressor/biotin-[acetyl-CoA-carboxylase] ligase